MSKLSKQRLKIIKEFHYEFLGLNERAKENGIFIFEEYEEEISQLFNSAKKNLRQFINGETYD